MRAFVQHTVSAAVAVVIAALTAVMAHRAEASVRIDIDLSSQHMTVAIDGQHTYSWPISSGKRGHTTPTGSYRPTRLVKHYHSRKYDAPMPYSIFFRGGYAIHETDETYRLGRRASHGCIRLSPRNAARLFYLVREHGKSATRIVVRR
jgi:lipoprotein-anchoring transpeptidase ErfK/SrfK